MAPSVSITDLLTCFLYRHVKLPTLCLAETPSESAENRVKHRKGCQIFVKDVLIKIPTPPSQNTPLQGVIADAKHECNWVTFAGSLCVHVCAC